MKVNKDQLQVGTRYWLDSMKDCSAVYAKSEGGTDFFTDLQGEPDYLEDGRGYIKIAGVYHTIDNQP